MWICVGDNCTGVLKSLFLPSMEEENKFIQIFLLNFQIIYWNLNTFKTGGDVIEIKYELKNQEIFP